MTMSYTRKHNKFSTLLFISRDEALVQTLSQELPKWGINISSTVNLQDIYPKVMEKAPDIVLLDGDLEIGDGEMSSILKLKNLQDKPSIIVCIGIRIDRHFGSLFEEMKKLYFISKPVLPESLVCLIDDISRRDRESCPPLKKKSLVSERRRYIRAETNFPLSCILLDKIETPSVLCQVEAQAGNISCEGMMLDIRKDISLPPIIELEFSLPALYPTLMVSGEIRWKITDKLPHQQYIGIKFRDLTERSQSLITSYVYSAISK